MKFPHDRVTVNRFFDKPGVRKPSRSFLANVSRKDNWLSNGFTYSAVQKSCFNVYFCGHIEAGFFVLNKVVGLTVIILLFVAFSASGCKSVNVGTNDVSNTRAVEDDLGNKIKLPQTVDRVVSLAPNLTEIIYAVGGGEKLVGVTTYCNYPAEAEKVNKVGDTLKPNIETIIALKPQLVFVSTASQLQSFSKVLNQQGIQVYVTNPSTLEDVFKSITEIAEIFGTSEKSGVLIKELRARAEKSSNAFGERLPVFVQIDKSLYTIGKGAFISDVIKRLNLRLVTDDINEPFPKISKERAKSLKPEIIILTDSPDNDAPNEVFADSPAVKNGRVYRINADILSRPGPRIVDAMQRIAELDSKWTKGKRK